MAQQERSAGTIARLVRDKGFGFIREEGGSRELFFHRSSVTRGGSFDAMTEGQRVEYVAGNTDKGPRAEQVGVV